MQHIKHTHNTELAYQAIEKLDIKTMKIRRFEQLISHMQRLSDCDMYKGKSMPIYHYSKNIYYIFTIFLYFIRKKTYILHIDFFT